ncbi:MAG TPA: hypothetical protein VHC20_03225 [Candidatus Paceibacterota bacterium]|nr:hypothetical protein [Candidatus Paceibacterota bacterium]
MIVKVAELVGRQLNLAGATFAGKLRGQVVEKIRNSEVLAPLVVFDFDGIESASASFLKALVFGLLPEAEPRTGLAQEAEQPPEAFPVVAGLSPLVREELVDYVELAGTVAVEAIELNGEELLRARLVGHLDDALKSTLCALLRKGASTATELHAEAGIAINITAWNNRLSDLHSRRLARRRRNGKQWVYEPIARELGHG